MRVKVTKEFPWAPDGNHVRYVKPGEVLEGRGAEVALAMQAGEAVTGEVTTDPSNPPTPESGAAGPGGPPAAEASLPEQPEQKMGPPGFSTADIGRKKRHGR